MGIVEATIGAAILSAVGGAYFSKKQERAQKRAERQAQLNSQKQAEEAAQASNRANQRRMNPLGMQQEGKVGVSGTMLTGPQGGDPGALSLGKSSLLGQ